MKCPVCKKSAGYYKQEKEPGAFTQEPCPLYQRGYSHEEPEYISPRCSKCFDQAIVEEGGK